MLSFLKFFVTVGVVTGMSTPVSKTKPMTKFVFVGDTPPLGYFDPLGFMDNVPESEIKFSREAELKHGRIAMVAAIAQPILENVYHKPFINILFDSGLAPNLMFFTTASLFESIGIFKAWKSPFGDDGELFTLKDDHEPGCYNPEYMVIWGESELLNKELNNGRLAMMAIFYTMVLQFSQEFSH